MTANAHPTLEEMWLSLDVAGALFGRAYGRAPLRYRDVQAVLDQFGCAVALVEFFDVPNGVRAFVLRSGDKQPRVIEWECPKARLEYLLQTYYRELVQYQQYGPDQRWQELASPFIQSVLPALEGVELLYLIPHGMWAYLPFHALGANGGLLIEKFPIVYAPSANVFTRILRHSSQAARLRNVLVVGNPTLDLEHAEDEAEWVAGYFGVRPYLGREATKIKIRAQLPDKDLIHVASHGFFHANAPFQSGLLMAGKRILNVDDINAAHIQADLVTLSACESGLNDPFTPAQSAGLSRAFLESGASSVLGTLWRVVDETTTLFMSVFYKLLCDGAGHKLNTKAAALQQAMLTLRGQKEHPYYWAAYTLTGSWR